MLRLHRRFKLLQERGVSVDAQVIAVHSRRVGRRRRSHNGIRSTIGGSVEYFLVLRWRVPGEPTPRESNSPSIGTYEPAPEQIAALRPQVIYLPENPDINMVDPESISILARHQVDVHW